jgi:glycosyltransferase involved in cell wall biosynthesis
MILMYHKVFPDSPTMWWVKVDEFYRQMWELQTRQVVNLDNYDPADPNQVVITFDGVYSNVLTYAAPILQKFGYPFELFVVGDLIGCDNDFDVSEPPARFASLDELEELEGFGGRLQWHTRSHPDMGAANDIKFIDYELSVPEELSSWRPSSFQWFAYTHGKHNPQVLDVAKRRFRGAVSCVQGNEWDRHQLNRVTVMNDTTFKRGRVACIIASYNYGAFLTEAIESVMRQTVKPDEILIVDDCSEDDTQAIAEEFALLHPEIIRYHRNEQNLGIVDNFNRAVAMTTSEYVMILGADNRLASNYIEECVAALESDATVGIAYTDVHLFGPRARMIYDAHSQERRGAVVENTFFQVVAPGDRVCDAEAIRIENFIHGSSMFRREAFEAVGGYLRKDNRPEDYDLFYRILKNKYEAIKCSGTTLQYRQHSREQANNRYVSYAALLHYIEKSRRLERQLQLAESSLWRRVAYPIIVVCRGVAKFDRFRRAQGTAKAVKKGYERLRQRLGAVA